MRKTTSLALTLLLAMHMVSGAFAAESVATQIAAMPPGTIIELALKTKQKMRGTTGPVSTSGFTLVQAGSADQQIAFDDIASVKVITRKSHLTRNILIVVGIGVAAVAITAAVLLRCGSLGCNRSAF